MATVFQKIDEQIPIYRSVDERTIHAFPLGGRWPGGPDEGGKGEVFVAFSPHQSATLTASPQGEAMALCAN